MTLRAKSVAPPLFRVVATYSDGTVIEFDKAPPGVIADWLHAPTTLELLVHAAIEPEQPTPPREPWP